MVPFIISLLVLISIGVHCEGFTREATCGNTKHFRFDEELPSYNAELSYCQYYRGYTCCNRTHTDKIIKKVFAYHEANMSSDCRSIGLNIGCSPCDPRIGTNQIKGICESYCNQWYDRCSDDFFHYNNAILTACSESDIVCSKLSSIAKNGTELCRLSGYDMSHVSINCYNGIKAKFTSPPHDKQWQTPIDKILQMLRHSTLNKNLKLLIYRYSTMPFYQQVLAIGGFAYTLFMIFKITLNMCSSLFCAQQDDEAQEKERETEKEAERQEIRNKRLEYLKKQSMMSDQVNMEMKLAKQLGLDIPSHDA